MKLHWLNPVNSLAGRIFIGFWLVLLLTVTLTLLLSRQLIEDTEIRRLPPPLVAQIQQEVNQLSQSTSVSQLLVRLKHPENSRWVVIDVQQNTLLTPDVLPRNFNKNWLIELNQLNRPRLLRHNNSHLAGPFMLAIAGEQLALYQQRQRPAQPWWRLSSLSEPILILLLLLTSATASFILAISISRPLRELVQQNLLFAAGKLDSRVPNLARRKDELGQLGRSFNTMAERISALLQNQQRLMRDISHELRSPLARAQLALGLTERQQDLQQLPRLKNELERLDLMLDELLTYSRLDAGQYQLELHACDLVALTEEVISINQLDADTRGQRITLQAPRQVWLEADSRLLGRAIENILRNALKYSPANSKIECIIMVHQQALCLSIRDYGPGIPTTLLDNVFLPFYRVSDSRTGSTGGTGLGLAIVAQIIRQHQGEVVAILPTGGGLQVNVTLPLPSLSFYTQPEPLH
ncbi:two-component sensor histidine kinase [Alishewanella longhuensis]|uniref:histidine kinase n=1 Tax=Alishewanella longhuensis TaxID=1091037 RepID=A0ABQ3L1S9_9ALTE|nr:ATP-binding protein [Alishewanella longhuensis]GHG76168.1 two-component sensor histidine kinase [Alishewanella longhuensis]